MIKVKCVHKYRDKNDVIKAYKIADASGKEIDIEPSVLKAKIRNGEIEVINLVLTSDNKLRDKAAEVEKVGKKNTLGQAYDADKILEILKKIGCGRLHRMAYKEPQLYKDSGNTGTSEDSAISTLAYTMIIDVIAYNKVKMPDRCISSEIIKRASEIIGKEFDALLQWAYVNKAEFIKAIDKLRLMQLHNSVLAYAVFKEIAYKGMPLDNKTQVLLQKNVMTFEYIRGTVTDFVNVNAKCNELELVKLVKDHMKLPDCDSTIRTQTVIVAYNDEEIKRRGTEIKQLKLGVSPEPANGYIRTDSVCMVELGSTGIIEAGWGTRLSAYDSKIKGYKQGKMVGVGCAHYDYPIDDIYKVSGALDILLNIRNEMFNSMEGCKGQIREEINDAAAKVKTLKDTEEDILKNYSGKKKEQVLNLMYYLTADTVVDDLINAMQMCYDDGTALKNSVAKDVKNELLSKATSAPYPYNSEYIDYAKEDIDRALKIISTETDTKSLRTKVCYDLYAAVLKRLELPKQYIGTVQKLYSLEDRRFAAKMKDLQSTIIRPIEIVGKSFAYNRIEKALGDVEKTVKFMRSRFVTTDEYRTMTEKTQYGIRPVERIVAVHRGWVLSAIPECVLRRGMEDITICVLPDPVNRTLHIDRIWTTLAKVGQRDINIASSIINSDGLPVILSSVQDVKEALSESMVWLLTNVSIINAKYTKNDNGTGFSGLMDRFKR